MAKLSCGHTHARTFGQTVVAVVTVCEGVQLW